MRTLRVLTSFTLRPRPLWGGAARGPTGRPRRPQRGRRGPTGARGRHLITTNPEGQGSEPARDEGLISIAGGSGSRPRRALMRCRAGGAGGGATNGPPPRTRTRGRRGGAAHNAVPPGGGTPASRGAAASIAPPPRPPPFPPPRAPRGLYQPGDGAIVHTERGYRRGRQDLPDRRGEAKRHRHTHAPHGGERDRPVSYTHLTLPTKRIV